MLKSARKPNPAPRSRRHAILARFEIDQEPPLESDLLQERAIARIATIERSTSASVVDLLLDLVLQSRLLGILRELLRLPGR